MSRLIKCDQCGKISPAARSVFLGDDYDYLLLTVEANDDADHAQFCGWLCLGAFAMDRATASEATR